MTTKEEFSKAYPQFAGLLEIPEIAKIIEDAGETPISETEFELRIRETDWWKSTTEPGRVFQVLLLVDPAEANRIVAQNAQTYAGIAAAEGANISLADLTQMAHWGLASGWTEDDARRVIIGMDTANDPAAGAISAEQDWIRERAAAYGIDVSDDTAYQWAKDIRLGNVPGHTRDDFANWASNQAQILYPVFSDQIANGRTVAEVFEPYRNIAATVLGLNPEDIDLTESKWSVPLTQYGDTDAKTAYSRDDWTTELMSNDAYGYSRTANGINAGASLINAFQNAWGF